MEYTKFSFITVLIVTIVLSFLTIYENLTSYSNGYYTSVYYQVCMEGFCPRLKETF
jgi:hypothetical protein